jgi:hypothetical protein
MSHTVIVAIDPGKHIGVAFVSLQGELGWHTITDLTGLTVLELPHNATVIVGNGTGAQQVTRMLQTRNIHYQLVEERNTSLEARQLYFADHPPRGWQRLLPPGLRSPNVLIDDYAAYAIALRFLKTQQQ